MTINFKAGLHPDADQLSAFIEQALPAHERDGVLAHLAVCAECRNVVALALPEVPAAVPVLKRPRALFTGWMVLLPAAAAMAALAAFIFFVHRESPTPQQQAQVTAAPSTGAPENLQAASQSAPTGEQREAPAAKQAVPHAPRHAAEARSAANESSSVSGSAGVMPSATNEPAAPPAGVVQNRVVRSMQSVPEQNAADSFAPTANNAVVSQNHSTDKAGAQLGVFHGGAIGGTIQLNNKREQTDANAQNRQQQNAEQQTASQNVQVQAELPAPTVTESAEFNTVTEGRALSNASFTRRPVPSGLPLLSSAAQGPIMLAIDIHHTVFVSNDSGQHWKTVQAVWKGRAVRVEAAAHDKMISLPETAASVSAFASLSPGAMAAKKGGVSLTGSVTDQSGAVIPGAKVIVTDPQNHIVCIVTTGANGLYVAAGLAPGKYDLEVSAMGFARSRLTNVAVTTSNESVANVTLPVAAMSESVMVESTEASVERQAEPKSQSKRLRKARDRAELFEIVTDKGVHWMSADGVTWKSE